MKRRAVYSAVNEFKNEAVLDEYIRENNSFPIFTTNNNPNNCTLCHNDDKHKMQVKYLKCSCKNDWCSLKYVIKRLLERLLSRIINKRKKELEKAVKERNDKYVYNKCLIPSIKQVN